MRHLHIDFETYSEVLIKQGAYKYFSCESAEILCVACCIDDGEINHWSQLDAYPIEKSEAYQQLLSAIEDSNIVIYAHNADFERLAIKYLLGIDLPPAKFRDTMAICLSLCIPPSLEEAAKFLKASEEKSTTGKNLINRFCKPRKPTRNMRFTRWTPEKDKERFRELVNYCIQDVRTERAIANKLKKYSLPEREQKAWELDSRINDRGLPVDISAVKKIVKCIELYINDLCDECDMITGGISPSQVGELRTWLQDQGVDIPNLRATTVAAVLDNVNPSSARRVLEIRQEVSLSSTKKYYTMLKTHNDDNRIRGTLFFHGANTGRWAGRLIQPQNFPKPSLKDCQIEEVFENLNKHSCEKVNSLYEHPVSVFSSCLRGTIKAPDGRSLIVADYSSIEAIVLSWLTGNDKALVMYKTGVDPYIEMAKVIFSNSGACTDEQRALGKAAVLGCGYGMGKKRFFETCEAWGITVSESLAEKGVYAFRKEYKQAKSAWYDVDKICRRVISQGGTYKAIKCEFTKRDGAMFIKLPSGRSLCYPRISVTDDDITFYGKNVTSVNWSMNKIWGGTVVQNICQAVARDFLVEGMFNLEEAGFEIISTIHDEIICEIDKPEDEEMCDFILDFFCQTLTSLPHWGEGIPLSASGYINDRYKK